MVGARDQVLQHQLDSLWIEGAEPRAEQPRACEVGRQPEYMRLLPLSHVDCVAASATQGCSLCHLGLQPLSLCNTLRAAASATQGCSLCHPGLQPLPLRAAAFAAQGSSLRLEHVAARR